MKRILIALVAILAVFSCKENESVNNVTSGGYHFEVDHTIPDGQKVQVGEYVSFGVKLKLDGEKIIRESSKGPNAPILKVDKLTDFDKRDFVREVLSGAQKGDLFKIVTPLDSIPQAKMTFPDAKNFVYEIYVDSILNEEQFTVLKEQRDAEMKVLREKQMALRKKFEENKKGYIKREKSVANALNKTIDSYRNNKLELKTTESGLKYVVHEEGKGSSINNGDDAHVMYYGSLLDKKSFDNSFGRGMPFTVPVGKGAVIKGWDEALQLLKKGDKATLFIPADLAYGAEDKPGIPGGSELAFYIEILED